MGGFEVDCESYLACYTLDGHVGHWKLHSFTAFSHSLIPDPLVTTGIGHSLAGSPATTAILLRVYSTLTASD